MRPTPSQLLVRACAGLIAALLAGCASRGEESGAREEDPQQQQEAPAAEDRFAEALAMLPALRGSFALVHQAEQLHTAFSECVWGDRRYVNEQRDLNPLLVKCEERCADRLVKGKITVAQEATCSWGCWAKVGGQATPEGRHACHVEYLEQLGPLRDEADRRSQGLSGCAATMWRAFVESADITLEGKEQSDATRFPDSQPKGGALERMEDCLKQSYTCVRARGTIADSCTPLALARALGFDPATARDDTIKVRLPDGRELDKETLRPKGE